jgi:hypothetical protein
VKNPIGLPAVLLRYFQNGQKPVFTQNANINKMGKQQDILFIPFPLFFPDIFHHAKRLFPGLFT